MPFIMGVRRRTTGIAILLGVGVVAAGAIVWSRAHREISNTELIRDCSNLAQLDERKQTFVREELVRRLNAGSLSQQELHDAAVANLTRISQFDTVADADVPVLNALSGRAAIDDDIRRLSSMIPLRLTAEYPAYSTSNKVPAGIRSWAFLQVTQFSARLLGDPAECARARIVGQEQWIVRSARDGLLVPVPPMSAGPHSVQFEVQVGDMTESGEFQPLRTAITKRDVEAVPVRPPAMKESAEMEAALHDKLKVTLEDHDVGENLIRIEPKLQAPTIGTAADELGLELRLQIEIVCGDVVVGRLFFVGGADESCVVPRSWLSRQWKYVITGEPSIPGVDGENIAERLPLWSGRIERNF